MVVLEYWDGPTSGVVQCGGCAAEYDFLLIDWDYSQYIRVFSLASLPQGSLDAIVQACPRDQSPQWSEWPVFIPRWQFPSESLRNAADQRVQEILDQAEAPEWVVAWADPREGCRAAKKLDSADSSYLRGWVLSKRRNRWSYLTDQSRDWFSFMGLVRSVREGDFE